MKSITLLLKINIKIPHSHLIKKINAKLFFDYSLRGHY
jgi:hypothetical protein